MLLPALRRQAIVILLNMRIHKSVQLLITGNNYLGIPDIGEIAYVWQRVYRLKNIVGTLFLIVTACPVDRTALIVYIPKKDCIGRAGLLAGSTRLTIS
jgi:hypothetical protein